ncbi:uncharacterized protein PGTG_11361 [Puccinia graminis f. sp. tritici CRL 75-36-700-3]|uniref:Uncharacterized protein n=1 Tax=Puccinia graminis f. sp. tritici (strain CRL 75-36-700-3 / race SCCL) TaxID=418459 RepID=E3KLL7_PUCGT|nr:uncharacterized protein PGTG_11361 [Puccinia graminis f. sp. tritici CRL 75-36-700-3]EFP85192.1 hypothetical protein PGTG_11361 [Puccinia graminis f. sp. tritici CRL 75-36-700-3]
MKPPVGLAEALPQFPCVLDPVALRVEVVAWFQRVQWAHTQLVPYMRDYKLLSHYADRTHQDEHFNLFLFGMPVATRAAMLKSLLDTFQHVYTLNHHILPSDDPLPRLLLEFGMPRVLYNALEQYYERKKPLPISMGDTLTGHVPPAVGNLMELDDEDEVVSVASPLENSMTVPPATVLPNVPTQTPIRSPELSPSERELAIAITTLAPEGSEDEPPTITKKTARQLLHLMRGILDRSLSQQRWFDSQKKQDHKQFCKALLNETHRHQREVDLIIRARHYQLKDQGIQYSDACNEIDKLQSAMAELAVDLGVNDEPDA